MWFKSTGRTGDYLYSCRCWAGWWCGRTDTHAEGNGSLCYVAGWLSTPVCSPRGRTSHTTVSCSALPHYQISYTQSMCGHLKATEKVQYLLTQECKDTTFMISDRLLSAQSRTQSVPTSVAFTTEEFSLGSRWKANTLRVKGSVTVAFTHQQVSCPLTHLHKHTRKCTIRYMIIIYLLQIKDVSEARPHKAKKKYILW